MKPSTSKLINSLKNARKKYFVSGPQTGGKKTTVSGPHRDYVRSMLAKSHKEGRKRQNNPRNYANSIRYNHGS